MPDPCTTATWAGSEPFGEVGLIQSAFNEKEHPIDNFDRPYSHVDAVDPEEQRAAGPAGPLVGVIEGVIAGKAVGVGGSQVEKIQRARFGVGELVDRAAKGALQ
jgi:hypothetical protein